jgi:hypothetical protein
MPVAMQRAALPVHGGALASAVGRAAHGFAAAAKLTEAAFPLPGPPLPFCGHVGGASGEHRVPTLAVPQDRVQPVSLKTVATGGAQVTSQVQSQEAAGVPEVVCPVKTDAGNAAPQGAASGAGAAPAVSESS